MLKRTLTCFLKLEFASMQLALNRTTGSATLLTASLCRLAKLYVRDDDSMDEAAGLIKECLGIIDAILQRYQRAGDLVSAVVLAEGTCFALEDLLVTGHPELQRLTRKAVTWTSALDDDEVARVRRCAAPYQRNRAAHRVVAGVISMHDCACAVALGGCSFLSGLLIQAAAHQWAARTHAVSQRYILQVGKARRKFHALDELSKRYTDALQAYAQKSGHERNKDWEAGRTPESLA